MSSTSGYGVPAGWYPDPQGPGQRYWDGASWHPVAAVESTYATWDGYAAPVQAWPWAGYADPYAEARADETARSIATYERVSGVLWIVLGIVQVFSLVLIIAGVWNIIAGASRLGVAPAIQRREARVPHMFNGIAGLIIIGLVNLFFGAVFGLVMVAVDFYVRQRVLDNRAIFTR